LVLTLPITLLSSLALTESDRAAVKLTVTVK
jgi:hypothetical protein